MLNIILILQQLIDEYFLKSNDKIRYFFEKDALAIDGKLKVDPSVSLNKVIIIKYFINSLNHILSYQSERRTFNHISVNNGFAYILITYNNAIHWCFSVSTVA